MSYFTEEYIEENFHPVLTEKGVRIHRKIPTDQQLKSWYVKQIYINEGSFPLLVPPNFEWTIVLTYCVQNAQIFYANIDPLQRLVNTSVDLQMYLLGLAHWSQHPQPGFTN